MSLLQISEPTAAPTKSSSRLAIGIDLGTTNSLVATVVDGTAVCLADDNGQTILPSIVNFQANTTVTVGALAKDKRITDPANTISSVKRYMGRSVADIRRQEPNSPYQFIEKEGMLAIQTAAGVKSPVEISAEVLTALKKRVQQQFDQEIYGAVITVPAYFDDAQRQSTKDAARLAGLNVLRLINEPTAAAIAYGLDNNIEGVYVVFDLGGGTFDVSILKLSQGIFEVIATGGNTALGGDDYDRALAVMLVDKLSLPIKSKTDWTAITVAAKHCKERFTGAVTAANPNPEVNFSVTLADGQQISQPVSYQQFCQAGAYLTKQIVQTMNQVLADAQLQSAEINGVVMVGGSSRMPVIQQTVKDFFSQEPLVNLNPDEVVALGAARHANKLAGNSGADNMLLLDVIPLSLGIETMGGLVDKIVPRNSTIPTAMAKEFTTYKDGQTAMAIHVVQGERELVADCRSLAKFELRGIPPMTAGAARILVTFTIDADGLLQVSASEKTSGIETHITVKPSYGLTDDEITRMLKDSLENAEQDMQARILAEMKLDAWRLIETTSTAIKEDAHLLTAAEETQIKQQIAQLEQLCHGTDSNAIDAAAKQLAHTTEPFAAKRMDEAIKKALTGQNIEQIISE